MGKHQNRKPMTAEHLEKVKRNLSAYIENESPEQKQQRANSIATHRKREAALYRYMERHKDILKRVIKEVKDTENGNDI